MKKKFFFTVALLCAVAQGTWAETRVKNESELAQAVKTNGASIVLTDDFDLSQPITIQGDNGGAVTVTINMNGKKLTYKKSVGQTTASCVFVVPAASTLNLSNGTIADVSNVSGNNTEYVAAALVNNGTATLDAVTISGCKGLLGGAIKNNDKATLNLKSCTFDSNEAVTNNNISGSGNGGAIWNDGIINISKSDNLSYNIKIQYCDAVNGAAIYNGANGVVTMSNDNTDASFYNNKATVDGGAIYNLGSVSLSANTSLNNNIATNNAGAIWNSGALSLKGCEVSYNKAKNGAAIYTSGSDKSVTITGGSMETNIASVNGGVVYCDGKLAMDAVTFEDNQAKGDGGAIYVTSNGNVTITDQNSVGNKINNNTATSKGGAIYANGILAMGGISATANTANAGGMIYVDGGGNVTLNANTSLTENKSTTQGGAIYDAGTLAISGKIAVKQNTGASEAASNVYLTSGKVINVAGSIASSNIGILLADTTGVFTKDYNSTNSGTDPGTFFTSDYYQQFYGVTLSKNEALLDVKSPIMIAEESVLRQALDMFDKVSVKLSNDIKLSNSTLEIKSGKTVTLDLGGFTLDRGRTSREWNTGGQVITVRKGGTLNLSNGTLTGGWGGASGGINNEGGTVNLTDVTITGCTGDDRGGGICNRDGGTLTMKGGSLTNNTSNDATHPRGGGGLFNAEGATATLTGVTITGNKNKTYGGGGICNFGTLTIDGCTITGNTAGANGGAIWQEGTLNLQGKNTITDNQAGGKANNIYLYKTVINVTGSLAGGNVSIQMEDILGTFTSGYKKNNADVDPATVFKADNAVVFVPTLAGEEAALTLQPLIIVANDTDLRTAVSFDGANIQLANDIQMSNSTLVIGGGKTLTIDLNGKTLDRGLTSRDFDHGGQVITVRKGGTLNLSNGTLTGGYGGNGGGLANEEGTATLTNVNITGCKADQRGGGISNYGTLTVTGGSITGNTSNDIKASDSDVTGGGGIFTSKGSTTTLKGVTIKDNQAKGAGGGGFNNWGASSIDSCTVTGNTCKTNGGGVWSASSSTLSMQGKNTITDNQGNGNVYLSNGMVITVTGSLTGSQIGISMQTPGVFTSGYSQYNKDVPPIKDFISDNDAYIVNLNGNEVELRKKMEVGINSVESSKAADGTWYDMNGRRLDGKPTTKGVYINNGVKVVVK